MSSVQPVKLIDLPVHRFERQTGNRLLPIAAFVFLFAFVIGGTNSPQLMVNRVWAFLFAAFSIASLVSSRRAEDALLLRKLEAVREMDAENFVRMIASSAFHRLRPAGITRVAAAMVREGLTNVVVRFSAKSIPPVELAVCVPIEPLRVADSGGAFDEQGLPQARRTTTIFTHIYRNVLLRGTGVTGLLGYLILARCTMLPVGSVLSIESGLMVGFLLYILFISPMEGTIRQPAQTFLVAGGLIRRSSGRFDTSWQSHLFRPETTVMIAYQRFDSKSWCVHVVDKDVSHKFICTRDEARSVLRAWLSPVPPPDITTSDLQ